METFFRFINIYPIPLWLAMMFAPKHRFTERAARSSSLFGIAALNYLMALLLGFRSGVSEDQGLPDFTSLDGISTSLGTREGALGAWSHMLALDLFIGAWIYRQCRRLNAPVDTGFILYPDDWTTWPVPVPVLATDWCRRGRSVPD